jgi:hypothetical protein
MQKIIESITKNIVISISLGLLLFIAGVLSRGQFIQSNMIISLMVPLIFISLGFGFVFAPLFKKNGKTSVGLFIKSALAPWAIVIAITILNKTGVDSPIIKAGTLFLINIVFFKKEIDKAVNL